MSLHAARSQTASPTAEKQNGLLGKTSLPAGWICKQDFFVVLKVARCNTSHKTRVIRREEINSQTFLETAVLPGCTLLMLYNAFSGINQEKKQLMVLLCLCSKCQMHCFYYLPWEGALL